MKVAKARKQQILPNLDRHAEAAGASTVTSTALALEQNGAGFEESDGEARRAEDTVATPPYAVGARSRFRTLRSTPSAMGTAPASMRRSAGE
ncbi:MAG: hypothetical protein ABSG79_07745 [Bryobacteraceae bacterium]|jgi:hypothetical protein